MKGRVWLILHFAALIGASIWAYLVFDRGEEDRVEAIEILNVKMSDVTRLVFTSLVRTVEVKPSGPDRLIAAITETVAKPRSGQTGPADPAVDRDAGKETEQDTDADTDTGAPDAVPRESQVTETKTARYRLSRVFEEKWDGLLPLEAKRDLGHRDQGDLERFGLASGDSKLVFETQGQKVTFWVGGRTFGGATAYVRPEPDGPVYLVSAEILRSIDFGAPRYMERKLVGFDKEEIHTVSIETKTVRKEIEQIGAGKEARWIVKGSGDSQSDLIGNWIAALFRLSAVEYTPTEDLPDLEPAARLDFAGKNEKLDAMELAQASAEDGKSRFFARTGYTGQWVELRSSDAQSAVADLATVVEQ